MRQQPDPHILYHMNIRQRKTPPITPDGALRLARELPIWGQDNTD